MNNISTEHRELIDAIGSVLHGTVACSPHSSSLDYEKLYAIARRNGVANTVADAICAWDGVPTEVKEKFRRQQLSIVAQQVSREHALKALYSELDEKRVRCLFLKGVLLGEMYPSPYIRSMSDVDVFAEIGDVDAIHSVMLSLGYKPGTIGRGNHYEYMMGEMVKVEYHPELVALESEYGRSVYCRMCSNTQPIAARMDVWSHAVPLEGYEYPRRLLPEYHYAYVIMHMMNHFLTAGTGIRSVMDVWVMNCHYADSWDRCKVEELLGEFGLATFERYALVLADRWFGFDDLPYLPTDVGEGTLDSFERYILESGTYGTTAHSLAREVGRSASAGNKVRYLISRFFLPYGAMCDVYPVLRKAPALLPLTWPYRVVEMLAKRGDSARSKIRTIIATDDERAASQAELFDAIVGR